MNHNNATWSDYVTLISSITRIARKFSFIALLAPLFAYPALGDESDIIVIANPDAEHAPNFKPLLDGVCLSHNDISRQGLNSLYEVVFANIEPDDEQIGGRSNREIYAVSKACLDEFWATAAGHETLSGHIAIPLRQILGNVSIEEHVMSLDRIENLTSCAALGTAQYYVSKETQNSGVEFSEQEMNIMHGDQDLARFYYALIYNLKVATIPPGNIDKEGLKDTIFEEIAQRASDFVGFAQKRGWLTGERTDVVGISVNNPAFARCFDTYVEGKGFPLPLESIRLETRNQVFGN